MKQKSKFKQTEIGMIPKDWGVETIEEASIEIIDGDRGVNYPNGNDFSNSGYCLFLNTKNVPNTMFDFAEGMFITKDKDEMLRKGKLKRKDIILTTRGTVGNIAIYDETVPFENIRINSGMVIIRNLEKDIITEFLYQQLKSPLFKTQVLISCSGTAQPQLPIRDLNKLNLVIPPLPDQSAIAKILSDLDSKIELNQQMNKTLEAIGQAIFKSWFIDFEFPNKKGKPYKSSGGEMVDSELEEIPKGWKVSTIGDCMEFAYGKGLPETKRKEGSFPVLGSNGIIGFHSDYLVKGPGIVIGRKGTLGEVYWIEKNFFPIDTTFYIIDKLKVGLLYFHYFILKGKEFLKSSSDSAVPGLNRNSAYSQSIIIPSEAIISKFNVFCQCLFNKKNILSVQSTDLSQIRDSLLPKLMSGKIRVPQNEA